MFFAKRTQSAKMLRTNCILEEQLDTKRVCQYPCSLCTNAFSWPKQAKQVQHQSKATEPMKYAYLCRVDHQTRYDHDIMIHVFFVGLAPSTGAGQGVPSIGCQFLEGTARRTGYRLQWTAQICGADSCLPLVRHSRRCMFDDTS